MIIEIKDTQLLRLLESIHKSKVICDNCGWSWNLSEGGDDMFVCHKCGHDNSEKK